jgi:hypothetical protein
MTGISIITGDTKKLSTAKNIRSFSISFLFSYMYIKPFFRSSL